MYAPLSLPIVSFTDGHVPLRSPFPFPLSPSLHPPLCSLISRVGTTWRRGSVIANPAGVSACEIFLNMVVLFRSYSLNHADKHFTFLQMWVKLKYYPGTCAENALLRSGVEVESTDWRHPTLTYIDARGTHSPPLFHLSVRFPLPPFALRPFCECVVYAFIEPESALCATPSTRRRHAAAALLVVKSKNAGWHEGKLRGRVFVTPTRNHHG